jgi:heat shock protein HslJ
MPNVVARRAALIAVVGLVAVTVLGTAGSAASALAAQPPGLTPADLANMTYRVPYTASGTATLVDGVYSEPAAPDSAASVVVTLTEFSAYGVLNGLEAAAVVLRSETGGSGVFFDLAVAVRESGRPVNLATTLLGDRVQIEHIAIEDSLVRVTMLQAGPMDPLCCPTQRVVNSYAIDLLQADSQVDAADPLAGSTWTWQETVFGDGTAIAPEGGRYSVAFGTDGLVRIQADCNSSSGSYTVEGDRLTIQLGPTTTAFCPPPSFSDAFLRSVAAAQAFQVEGETLLINLASEAGTMRFARSSVQS